MKRPSKAAPVMDTKCCKNCNARESGCHSTCPDYINARTQYDRAKKDWKAEEDSYVYLDHFYKKEKGRFVYSKKK